MKPLPPGRPTAPAVLLVSDDESMCSQLQQGLAVRGYPILCARSYQEAAGLCRDRTVAVIVSEAELDAYTWRDMIALSNEMARPAYLIVIARLVSEELWLEVLDRGGINLFARTPPTSELRRSVEISLMDWIHLP